MEGADENIDELAGEYYPSSQFIDYRADTQMPLPMIYQSGYLTIKDYDREANEYLLDFPNKEVKQGFISMITSSYLRLKKGADPWCSKIARALKKGDLEEVRKLMTSFFASIPYSQRRRANEKEQKRDFQYTFYLILRMLSSYLVFVEKETSEGRADCVLEAKDYVYIFEFKRDGTTAEAIKQINQKGYACEYEADKRKLYKIGCNISTQTGTISDWQAEKRAIYLTAAQCSILGGGSG